MTLLAVRSLAKSFGGIAAVGGVDFDVAAGEVVALIGPNGAGKTTCFNMVGGQLVPDAGTIRLDGHDIAGQPARRIWRLGVGRTFQIATTFASMTVVENVQVALLSHQGRLADPISRVASLETETARVLLAQVGMADRADRQASELAYGELKRLELAVALAGEPRLLLLDEPTAGLGKSERGVLMALIDQVVAARRVAVLFTEHDMDVVFGHAGRVIVLDRGRILTEGPPETVRADERVKDIYLGRGEVVAC